MKLEAITWWAVIRTLVLFHQTHAQDGDLNTETEGDDFSAALERNKLGVNYKSGQVEDYSFPSDIELSCKSDSHANLFLHLVLSGPSLKSYITVSPITNESTLLTNQTSSRKPKCLEGEGCDIPLGCFNYSALAGNKSIIPVPPQAMSVSPLQLKQIIENPAIGNNCVVVMFYAPWCEFSTMFARRFNSVGRVFKELPIVAVDLSENDSHSYILAYLPVVAFYYQSQVIYRFKLTETFGGLKDMIFKMTGFQPSNISLTDEESKYPVPVVRSNAETPFLCLAVAWIVFIALVYVGKTTTCVSFFVSKLQRTRTP